MFIRTMRDAHTEITSQRQLIRFFAMLIVHATPSDPKQVFDEILDMLMPPPIGNNNTFDARKEKVLNRLEYIFLHHNTSCK